MNEQSIKKEYTPDGYEIVYISKFFFDTLAKELNKIARFRGPPSEYGSLIALRDEPARIEFKRFEDR